MMPISLPAKAAQSTERTEGGDASYDRRLNELTEEIETIERELRRTCQVLRPDAGVGNSDTSCETIITALRSLHRSEAAKIIELTSETHRIADKMSYAIRVRAAERHRILQLQQLMEDISTLQADYHRLRVAVNGQDQDLEAIATLFHNIRHQASPRLVAAWEARYGTDLEGLLKQEQKYLADRLLGALHAHAHVIGERGGLEEAMAGVFTHIRLFQRIDALERVLPDISGIMHKFVTQTLVKIVDGQAMVDFRWAGKASKVVEFSRGLGSWCTNQCRDMVKRMEGQVGIPSSPEVSQCQSNSIDLRSCLVSSIMEAAIDALMQVLRRFLEEKHVSSLRREAAAKADARELDMIVAELALLVQSALSLMRDLQTARSPSQAVPPVTTTALLSLISDMVQSYGELESNYMRRGVRLAISMSEVSTDASMGARCSTGVGDLFFILKKVINRALALGDQPTILAIMEQARAIIVADFFSFVQRRSRQLYPDPRTGDCVKVCLNDITTARVYLLALTDEIKGLVDVKDGTKVDALPLLIIDSASDTLCPLDSFSRSKIITSANDLEMLVVTHMDGMARALTDTIYTTQIKSKLAPFLVQLFKDPLVYRQDEENDDEQETGALTTTLPSFMQHVEGTILPVLEGLAGDAKILLILLVAKEFAGALESKIFQSSAGTATTPRWTASSVAALEHDFRCVSGYLADLSELQSRESLLRITQLLMALGTDSKSEATSMARELLGEAQLKVFLSLRSDWW